MSYFHLYHAFLLSLYFSDINPNLKNRNASLYLSFFIFAYPSNSSIDYASYGI